MSAIDAIRAQLRERRALHAPLAARRMGMDAYGASQPVPDDHHRESIDLVPGLAADRVGAPNAVAGRTILYVHGGAYVAGSPRSHRPIGHRLAAQTRALVVLLDYRLAPEHPFPAAIEDVAAALRALAGNVVAIGDSAGAGALLAALTLLRDEGGPLPRAAALISPWVDLTLSGASHADRADRDPMLSGAGLAADAALYLAGVDAALPLASPLYADLAGLPPILIQVGEDEILYDDATRLAARLRAAGGDPTLSAWPDMFHVWHAFAGLLPQADAATADLARFANTHLEDPA